jgi:chorismate mutase
MNEEIERAMGTGDVRVVCRGLRGATTVSANTAEDILEATDQLLRVLIALNRLDPDDIASAVFTTTPDLTATFPAIAARDLGWTDVPLLCSHEMTVPGALPRVVRVLLHVNTALGPRELRHVYLGDARSLRPDWGIADHEVAQILAPTGAPLPV